MAHVAFEVVFAERREEAFWRGSVTLAADHRNPLGRPELIEAHDMEEAVEITQRKYPHCTVMREGREKVRSA